MLLSRCGAGCVSNQRTGRDQWTGGERIHQLSFHEPDKWPIKALITYIRMKAAIGRTAEKNLSRLRRPLPLFVLEPCDRILYVYDLETLRPDLESKAGRRLSYAAQNRNSCFQRVAL